MSSLSQQWDELENDCLGCVVLLLPVSAWVVHKRLFRQSFLWFFFFRFLNSLWLKLCSVTTDGEISIDIKKALHGVAHCCPNIFRCLFQIDSSVCGKRPLAVVLTDGWRRPSTECDHQSTPVSRDAAQHLHWIRQLGKWRAERARCGHQLVVKMKWGGKCSVKRSSCNNVRLSASFLLPFGRCRLSTHLQSQTSVILKPHGAGKMPGEMWVFMCWRIWHNICVSIKSLKSQKSSLSCREKTKLYYIFHFLYQWEKIDVWTAWRLYTELSIFMNYLWGKKTFLEFNRRGCFFFVYCWKEKKKNQSKLLYLRWMFGKEHRPAETSGYDLDGTEQRAERSNVDTGLILNAIHHKRNVVRPHFAPSLPHSISPTYKMLPFTLLSRCILSKALIKTKAFRGSVSYSVTPLLLFKLKKVVLFWQRIRGERQPWPVAASDHRLSFPVSQIRASDLQARLSLFDSK